MCGYPCADSMSARALRRSLKMPDIRLQPIPALTFLRLPSSFAAGVHIRAVRTHRYLHSKPNLAELHGVCLPTAPATLGIVRPDRALLNADLHMHWRRGTAIQRL